MFGIKCFKLSFLLLICSLVFNSSLNACTRVLSNNSGPLVLVGRNMDWLNNMPTLLIAYPQKRERDGLDENPLKWTAKYGSVVAAVVDSQQPVSTDGMNEVGLSAHILWLAETDYGVRDPHLPGLSVSLWVQFYLDNFKTVNEAVDFTTHTLFQITPYYDPRSKRWVNVHLALEDRTGDSAIIEYVNGKAHIYHNRAYTVLTNSPTYDKQLANAATKMNEPETNLGGSNTPVDRFVRAAFYVQRLKASDSKYNYSDQIRSLISIMQNVAEPFGAPSPERSLVTPTYWLSIADLTDGLYFFHTSRSFNMVWVDLKKLDFNVYRSLSFRPSGNYEASGDVSDRFAISHW